VKKELEERRVSGLAMLSKLPIIKLSDINDDVTALLESNGVDFKPMEAAPWWIRKFSERYCEYYIPYKQTLYVATGHIAIATSEVSQDRVIATSKILPWVYAIKNGSVSSLYKFLRTMFNSEIRCYYFVYEFVFLKCHELQEVPELVATGFLSTRKNILGFKKNPDDLVDILRKLLATKVNRD
jgi:hypothetical protein